MQKLYFRFRAVRYFSLLLLTLALCGCGLHLRGMVDTPRWLNNVAIIIEPGQRDLGALLKEQLQSYHIQINDDPAIATYWLIIESDVYQQDISSVSSSTTPRQYQLIYTVRFKLQQAKGPLIMPSNQISVTRQITINSNRILGSNEEEALFKQEMQTDAAIQIIYRLSRTQRTRVVH